ncbi:LOW QUALITY PROTEIN: protein TIC 100-like [Dioscorea cayenensis subsp. rotundata]|uniref:LOW QUALITY PROTEIN: protein TIC 100-like n=1 Tax=Dioscorea cayennensis subsp. rotundata TaxID=55577 RepID=A0AB40BCZ0_DIOCR|nr:LOW QUALITY PROTEIN: protein TIC 100-like [Dioscorea cayenensis subsp. rotundata]
MAADDANQPQPGEQQQPQQEEEEQQKGGEEENEDAEEDELPSSSSSSSSESESDSESSDEDGTAYYDDTDDEEKDDNNPESNIQRFTKVLDSSYMKKRLEQQERDYNYHEDLFDFPKDPEQWREEDLRELWADAPLGMTKPGWDPFWADEEDWEVVREEIKEGRDPPIAPFYLPYRKYYPAIPDNHHDISNPKSVIEELDRIEEFLRWVSYIFPDGSTYEGTIWDDLAHGKGVLVAEQGLVRLVPLFSLLPRFFAIPEAQPIPGSKLEAKMRAEGRIITRDFMSPGDRKWLEKDIEDTVRLVGHVTEIPYYESDEWIKQFGSKPEKGRYRYAGQWKHGRMHGCGVYEVNERIIYGRFYFGNHVQDSTGCDENVSALHAGIAEVAAAKARMFVNKPDGMIREERGPYGDPQHPYFYDEEDVWMAPGFINQFYEVPDYWKVYVQEVDQEREMWLNSFYKAPLRLPMPAELEYWWSRDDTPEFVLINKEPEPDPKDPSKLIYTEDPLILHTRTGRLINYVEDEEHGVRLFWQPRVEDGEDMDPEKIEFLPLGFDEFYGRATPGTEKEVKPSGVIAAIDNAFKPLLNRIQKWIEENKKTSEANLKLYEKELEFIDAELDLEEAMEDMEIILKEKQKEEEKRAAVENDTDEMPASTGQDEARPDDGEDGDDDEDDEGAPTSFGTVGEGADDDILDGSEEKKSGRSPFSSLSMSLASWSLASMVPYKIQESFLSWKNGRQHPSAEFPPKMDCRRFTEYQQGLDSVAFHTRF